MLMNRAEYWLMNNPIRSWIQDRYESRLLRMASKMRPGADVLEIGCGQGIGRGLIEKYFKPKSYVGIDLDPRMVDRARRKNPHAANEFAVGDATALPFAPESFGAVFDYGIIHHIPNWSDALKEIYRVLKPGGECIFEEVSSETWQKGIGKILKTVLAHPYQQMFSAQEFYNALQAHGFTVEFFEQRSPLGLRFFYGIATK